MTNQSLFERIRFAGQPEADPASITICGNARFTVFTSRMLRLEWSETGQFEDRATYAFPIRKGPVPQFSANQAGGEFTLHTEALELHYTPEPGPFTAQNLSISFKLNGQTCTWHPGDLNAGNLRGTRRTLDGCERDAQLAEGLVSRAGWSLFDDSQSVLFGEDGWVMPRPEHQIQDWYFFGYGHDYQAAITEYLHFGGGVPLIPRFVLGAWWSRYWAYCEQDLRDLVKEFEDHDVPLDVFVIDMDWHTPHAWTGYTWNRELFPNPKGFLSWLRQKGLRITLNLHPAQGVQSFEEVYPKFAAALGIDPASSEAVPFRCTDRRFVKNYFELLHHPMEGEGVDFWWLDWQQGEAAEMKGLDPLPWLNHLHFTDSRRRGQRPMLYSRWGGLGNHRYPIGFSGDTVVGWPALQFQPYLTANAANVAYGWWSHDIGGHMGGATEPELYARWVQFGALSPCLRLHSTKDAACERRPWAYPEPVFQASRQAFHLRYQLIPYLYSMARQTTDTGVSLCRPMYYAYPETEDAYAARYQYLFGDQAIAAPIVFPADPATGLASTDVWVPEGEWIDFQTKELFTGPRWVRLFGDINRLPLLIKAGGILPLANGFEKDAQQIASGNTNTIPRDRLALSVYPGKAGSFRLYEDDGQTLAYQSGQYEWTAITSSMPEPGLWEVNIAPVEGRCAALPAERAWEIRLEGSRKPDTVLIDGRPITGWTYEPDTLTTIIRLARRDKRQAIQLTASAQGSLSALGDRHNESLVIRDVRAMLGKDFPTAAKGREALIEAVLASSSPARAQAIERLGGPFARVIEFVTPAETAHQFGTLILSAPADGSSYAAEIEFKQQIEGQAAFASTTKERLEGLSASQIIYSPFAFDGQPKGMRWQARARLEWRGQVISSVEHKSLLLFPTAHTWRVLYYNPLTSLLHSQQVVDVQGNINPELPWEIRQPDTSSLTQLHQMFYVNCAGEQLARLAAGEPAAAYLALTVHSPDERQASFLFQAGGMDGVYLNGRKVESKPDILSHITEPFRSRHFLPWVLKLSNLKLRKGSNTLLFSTKYDPKALWVIGGIFVDQAFQPMLDLIIT